MLKTRKLYNKEYKIRTTWKDTRQFLCYYTKQIYFSVKVKKKPKSTHYKDVYIENIPRE